MIEKLEELKIRTQKLNYNDKKELDDIQRKAKLYIHQIFPTRPMYPIEVDRIPFQPSSYVSGMGVQAYLDTWKQGKEVLINLLDARIEEAKLIVSNMKTQKPNIQVVEKVVQVKDYRRINELTQELNAVKRRKTLWERINYFAFAGIILTLLGGAFLLGKYFGENRFDNEKIDLLFENKKLTEKNDSLTKRLEPNKIEMRKSTESKK